MAASAAGRVLLWTAGGIANATTRPHDIAMCSSHNPEGVHLIRWIEVISGQCVYGTLGSVSWTFGISLSPAYIDERLLINLILVLCATSPNRNKLSKQFSRGISSCILTKLVHGIHPLKRS